MFKSIVVGFDGSAHASRALRIGAELAAQGDIPLGILYVIEPGHVTIPQEVRKLGEIEHVIDPAPNLLVNLENAPSTMISSMAQASADTERALYQYAEFLVGQVEEKARELGAGEVDGKSALGNPAEQIVEYARERDADLIITGCRGFGRLKGMLLGSTSQRVAQLAECSCLTVR